MANKSVDQLPQADLLAGDELFHIVQGGNSRKVRLDSIAGAFNGGWALFQDEATALEANAILIQAGQRTLITIDGGAGSITNYIGNSEGQWTGTKHKPGAVGDSHTTRLSFRAKKASAGGSAAYALIEQDIGNGLGPVPQAQEVALRTDTAAHPLSFIFASYALDTYFANGAQYYLTTTANLLIWDKRIFIRRDYSVPTI